MGIASVAKGLGSSTWTVQIKWTVLLGALAVCLASFWIFEDAIGPMAGLFVTFPVLTAAWLFGLRGGVAAGLLSYPINMGLIWLTMPGDVQT